LIPKTLLLTGLVCALIGPLLADDDTPVPPSPSSPISTPISTKAPDRVLGVLPNYRTAEETDIYQPITAGHKFYIGYKDSTDYPIFVMAGALAGLAQLTDQHPAFGQGMVGYSKRLGSSVADQLIGNFMTESIMPSLLREDPRYFRRGHGSILGRTAYAASRILITHTDSGGTSFNFAEVGGNAVSAVIGNAYYPGERRLTDNVQRLGVQLGTDAVSQILKEFWPDLKRKFFSHHKS